MQFRSATALTTLECPLLKINAKNLDQLTAITMERQRAILAPTKCNEERYRRKENEDHILDGFDVFYIISCNTRTKCFLYCEQQSRPGGCEAGKREMRNSIPHMHFARCDSRGKRTGRKKHNHSS